MTNFGFVYPKLKIYFKKVEKFLNCLKNYKFYFPPLIWNFSPKKVLKWRKSRNFGFFSRIFFLMSKNIIKNDELFSKNVEKMTTVSYKFGFFCRKIFKKNARSVWTLKHEFFFIFPVLKLKLKKKVGKVQRQKQSLMSSHIPILCELSHCFTFQ